MPTLFLTKVLKTYNGEDSPFNKCCWEKWLSACRKLKLDPRLSHCTCINSKWIKHLNIRPETLQFVQERAGNTLEAIGISKDFLNRTQAAQQLREKMNKCDSGYSRGTCSLMFIAALFTIAKLWKQPRCPTINEWIKKMWYLYIIESYSATKKNEILSFASKWMELKNIILSEVSQAQKAKNCMFSFILKL
jgi:hypothetical protein